MLYWLLRPIAVLFCKIFFRIQVRGRVFIPKKGGFILVSNHLSYLDPVILAVACPRKLNFMAKEELFNIPIFSDLIRCLGAFPVKRNSPDISAIKETFKRLNQKEAVVIFPEGKRNPEGRLLSSEKGVGFILVHQEVPVIPSYIKGTDRAMPRNSFLIRPRKICVYFGEEILIERRKPYNYAQISEQLMDEIRQLGCRYR